MNKLLITYIVLISLTIPLLFYLEEQSYVLNIDQGVMVEITYQELLSKTRLQQPHARFILFEFVDFNCEFCAIAHNSTQALTILYPNMLQLERRHFILNENTNSFELAKVYECSQDRQTTANWLYQNQPASTQRAIDQFNIFSQCMGAVTPLITQDALLVQFLNLRGTPSYFLVDTQTMSNKVFIGLPNIQTMQLIIEGWI